MDLLPLYKWQEPFRDLYGRKVRLIRNSGSDIVGELMPPAPVGGTGYRPPAKALRIRAASSGHFRLYRLDNVRKVILEDDA